MKKLFKYRIWSTPQKKMLTVKAGSMFNALQLAKLSDLDFRVESKGVRR